MSLSHAINKRHKQPNKTTHKTDQHFSRVSLTVRAAHSPVDICAFRYRPRLQPHITSNMDMESLSLSVSVSVALAGGGVPNIQHYPTNKSENLCIFFDIISARDMWCAYTLNGLLPCFVHITLFVCGCVQFNFVIQLLMGM